MLSVAKQEHRRHLGKVQVELVELPQHDKAGVQFLIETGGSVSRTIEFGKAGKLPRAVFGAVDDTATMDCDFPHVLVVLKIDTATTAEAADEAACAVGVPCSSFTVEGNNLFKGSWEKLVKRQDRRNRPIKFVLGCFCAVVSFFGVGLAMSRFLYSPPYVYTFLIVALGEVFAVFFAYDLWVKLHTSAASRHLIQIWRHVMWVLVSLMYATIGTLITGQMILMFLIFVGLFLVVDLPLACCGIRPTTSYHPFYRWFGLQGIKVPTLALTVRPNNDAVDQL